MLFFSKSIPVMTTFFVPNLRSFSPALMMSSVVLMGIFVKNSASNLFGVITVALDIRYFLNPLIAVFSISIPPVVDLITGSKIIGHDNFLIELKIVLIISEL